jgi:formylglycine-generating enzyme
MFCKAIGRGLLAAAMLCAAVVAQAAVTIDLVPVGNPGNTGEWSGESYNGWGADRFCGAVGYTYNIGKYEVTAGQYTAFLNAVGGVDTYALYNSSMSNTNDGCGITQSGGGIVGNPYTYSVATDFVNRPVNYVSYWDACRFTNWLNNNQPTGAQAAGTTESGAYTLDGYNGNDASFIGRNVDAKWAVASEDEWYKAAYYKGGSTEAGYWDFPTKSDAATPPGRDMADATGNNANYYDGSGSYPIDSGKYTTVAGQFQLSASPYGTFDQGGNVWEWNEASLNSSSPAVRGGSFDDGGLYGLLASIRNDSLPSDERNYMGFRVAGVPEPGSIVLLLAGAISLIAYTWRGRNGVRNRS